MSAAAPSLALARIKLSPTLVAMLSAETGAVRFDLLLTAYAEPARLASAAVPLDAVAQLVDALTGAACIAEELQFHHDVDVAYRAAGIGQPRNLAAMDEAARLAASVLENQASADLRIPSPWRDPL